MKTKTLVLIIFACFAGTALSYGQSLADLARQQRAKEASKPKATKVYTNDNIPHVTTMQEGPASTPSANESAPATPEGAPAEAANAASSQVNQPAGSEAKPEDKMKTKEYWQGKFAEAQADLNGAEEQLKLNQDELSLEQMNQARELDPERKASLDRQVAAKQGAVELSQAAYDKAKEALDKLKKEFEASGAPKEWLPAKEKQ